MYLGDALARSFLTAPDVTSVSDTIQKPPIVEAKTALGI